VALEYAHRQLSEVTVAWQFLAEDPTVLAAGFGELAAQLGTADGGDQVASVHALLAASPAPWLLVFDNAPGYASVAQFVPPVGSGRVAAEFLVSRTGDPDRRVALDLVGELGGLPLALEQAAAFVQARCDSLAGYLASFRRRANVLRRGEPTGHPPDSGHHLDNGLRGIREIGDRSCRERTNGEAGAGHIRGESQAGKAGKPERGQPSSDRTVRRRPCRRRCSTSLGARVTAA
jgi:hypothetical protein